MPKLTVAIFWDDDKEHPNPRVHPGGLVIDSQEAYGSVEFHSFVDRDVELRLPAPVLDPAPKDVAGRRLGHDRDPRPEGARLLAYRARLVRDNRDAQGGSMPRMIIIP